MSNFPLGRNVIPGPVWLFDIFTRGCTKDIRSLIHRFIFLYLLCLLGLFRWLLIASCPLWLLATATRISHRMFSMVQDPSIFITPSAFSTSIYDFGEKVRRFYSTFITSSLYSFPGVQGGFSKGVFCGWPSVFLIIKSLLRHGAW